jgi:hypothetical protein
MGRSEYDLVCAERRPWNAARKPGAKRVFKPQQVWVIRFYVDRERRLHDRALFEVRTAKTSADQRPCLVRAPGRIARRLRFPEPDSYPTHKDPTGCPASGRMGQWYWLAAGGLRTPPNESLDHLQGKGQSALYRSSSDIQRSKAPSSTSGSIVEDGLAVAEGTEV